MRRRQAYVTRDAVWEGAGPDFMMEERGGRRRGRRGVGGECRCRLTRRHERWRMSPSGPVSAEPAT